MEPKPFRKKLIPKTYEVDYENNESTSALLAELGVAAEKDLARKREKTAAGIRRAETTPEDRYNALSENEKLSTDLEITEAGEIGALPEEWRFAKITINKEDETKLARITKGLARKTSKGFRGDPKDKTITFTFVVPHQNNVAIIAQEASKAALPAHVSIAGEKSSNYIALRGGTIIPLSNRLHHGKRATGKIRSTKLKLIKADGTATSLNEDRFNKMHAKATEFEEKKPNMRALAFSKFKGIRRPAASAGLSFSIDLNEFQRNSDNSTNAHLATFVRDHIKPIIKSDQYSVVEHDGFLCITATSESLMKTLGQAAKDYFKATGGETSSFTTEIQISHHNKDEQGFEISGLPSNKLRQEEKLRKAAYIWGQDLIDDLENHITREARGCQIKLAKLKEDLAIVLSFKPIIDSYKEGGPREHIGAMADIIAIKKLLKNPKVRKLILEGPAGIGKSSLVEFLIKAGYIKEPIRLYIDPGESDIPGASLANVLTYVMEDAAKRRKKNELKNIPTGGAKILRAFGTLFEKDTKSLRKLVNEKPDRIVELVSNYCILLAHNYGQITPIFDNAEASDASSEKYLHQIIEKLSDIPGNKCKVLITARDEARYASAKAEKSNEAIQEKHGKESVARMTAKGAYFGDKRIVEAFIVGCLEAPLGLRLSEDPEQYHEDLKTYKIDPEIVARIQAIEGLNALQFTSIMQALAPELVLGEGNVIVAKEGSKRFAALAEVRSARDLSRFHANMLMELERAVPNSKALLEILAITKGKVTLRQAARAIGAEYATMIPAIDRLRADKYIVATEKKGLGEKESSELGDHKFSISHSAFAATISEGMSDETKGERSDNIETIIGLVEDEELKLTLTGNRAAIAEPSDVLFWRRYNIMLERAYNSEEIDSYTVAISVLDQFDPESKTTAGVALQALISGDTKDISPALQTTITRAILEIARTAILQGRFKQVQTAIELYERITKTSPSIVRSLPQELIQEAYLGGFHAARRQAQSESFRTTKDAAQTGKSTDQYLEKLEGLLKNNPHRLALVEMRMAYTKGEYDGLAKQCATAAAHQFKDGAPATYQAAQTSVETILKGENVDATFNQLTELMGVEKKIALAMLIMIKVRKPLERLIAALNKYDTDGAAQPGALDQDQIQNLLSAQKYASQLAKFTEENPEDFIPFDLLSLKEAQGQIAVHLAYESDPERPFEEGTSYLAETASMARRMGLDFDCARALSLLGKSQRIQAKTRVAQFPTQDAPTALTEPRHKSSTQGLQKAFSTLTEAFIPLHHVNQTDTHQVIVRADRIGTLNDIIGENGIDLEDKDTRLEITKMVKAVVEQDITFLTRDNYFSQWAELEFMCYYMLPCVNILKLAQILNENYQAGIAIPADCPYNKPPAIQKARAYGQTLKHSTDQMITAEMRKKAKLAQNA